MTATNRRLVPLSYQADQFVLRSYTAEDAEALQVATVESFEHLRPWMPWAKEDLTVDEAEGTCRRLAAEYMTDSDYTLGVWEGTELVGGTGFHLRCGPVEWRCAEIGMWIRGSKSGQGLGTKVLKAVLEWGFTDWDWQRLVWKCDTRNVASRRVAEKCGMLLEATHRSDCVDVDGNRRDSFLFAIVKADWSASH